MLFNPGGTGRVGLFKNVPTLLAHQEWFKSFTKTSACLTVVQVFSSACSSLPLRMIRSLIGRDKMKQNGINQAKKCERRIKHDCTTARRLTLPEHPYVSSNWTKDYGTTKPPLSPPLQPAHSQDYERFCFCPRCRCQASHFCNRPGGKRTAFDSWTRRVMTFWCESVAFICGRVMRRYFFVHFLLN